jgi:hypothetical protein
MHAVLAASSWEINTTSASTKPPVHLINGNAKRKEKTFFV